jgi:hypothetical protein
MQDLALAASPAARRVYVEGEHGQMPTPNPQRPTPTARIPIVPFTASYLLEVGSWVLGVFWISQSFANFRKTE